MSRVRSVNSPTLILLFAGISMVIAATAVPFWDVIIVLGTGFWFFSNNEAEFDFISVSMFHVEFVVGICMFCTVTWLLLFRMKEIKECWKLHRRIRYYFGLTILGTVANLALGICGTVNVALAQQDSLLLAWSWVFRNAHIALDTIVLYGVLRERNLDERTHGSRLTTNESSSG